MSYTIDDARNEWLDPDNWEDTSDPLDPVDLQFEVDVYDTIVCDDGLIDWGDASIIRPWAEDIIWDSESVELKSAEDLGDDILEALADELPRDGRYNVQATVILSFRLSNLYWLDSPDGGYYADDIDIDELPIQVISVECTPA